ncbi:hypothetical protein N7492_008580 [Penicillium capsulatum]|uniref:Uncharacterized protein n=1 Tax=Penicillium capsulatum TaxID=69766 RepID=A0A9W9HRU1_9EURO|nr:hypothetical protein N7492_008580 [Penicillium capsulatum]KAJ6105985.1 hypothetical protein N7512_009502 [Penicillium capsulatum]
MFILIRDPWSDLFIDRRGLLEPPVFAIDGRPQIHPVTLECFLGYVAVSAPVRKMVSSPNLADLAIMIRKAVPKADDQYTDDLIAMVEKLDDVDRLAPTAFLDVPGFNCVQSSWIGFKVYDFTWGPCWEPLRRYARRRMVASAVVKWCFLFYRMVEWRCWLAWKGTA